VLLTGTASTTPWGGPGPENTYAIEITLSIAGPDEIPTLLYQYESTCLTSALLMHSLLLDESLNQIERQFALRGSYRLLILEEN
jgi:hypothetical protein